MKLRSDRDKLTSFFNVSTKHEFIIFGSKGSSHCSKYLTKVWDAKLLTIINYYTSWNTFMPYFTENYALLAFLKFSLENKSKFTCK